jgi:hypothetical protein
MKASPIVHMPQRVSACSAARRAGTHIHWCQTTPNAAIAAAGQAVQVARRTMRVTRKPTIWGSATSNAS